MRHIFANLFFIKTYCRIIQNLKFEIYQILNFWVEILRLNSLNFTLNAVNFKKKREISGLEVEICS